MQTSKKTHWFTPLKSAGVLLMGKSAQGVLSIFYLALAARTLGVADFGLLVILNGLVVAVSEVARFDSWQVVLRYGTPPLEKRDRQALHDALKFTLILDALGSAFGLMVVLAGLGLAFELFALPDSLREPARVFSLGVVFLISTGGANGILRLLDRFDLISWQTIVAPVIRLAGTMLLFAMGGDLVSFLWLWLGATIVGRCSLHIMAWRELYRRGLLEGFLGGTRAGLVRDADMWRFAVGTSVNATLGVVDKHAGLLAAGALIGPTAAGLYRIALHLADLLIKPNRAFLTPAIYPELARLTARDEVKARGKMVRRTALLVGGVSIAVLTALAVLGEWLITLIFGPEFVSAYGVMILLALAGAVNICVFPLEPLLVSIGRVRATVATRLVSVSVYVILLYILLLNLGLIGAGVASCVYALVRAGSLVWLVRGGGANKPDGRTQR